MKAILESLSSSQPSSVKVFHFKCQQFPSMLHYHREYELVYIIKGKGNRYIGPNISPFICGDLILIGPGLTHYYKSEKNDAINCNDWHESLVVHFNYDALGHGFFSLPECAQIKQLLKQCEYGLQIEGENKEKLITLLLELENKKGMEQLLTFLTLLHLLSLSEAKTMVTGGVSIKHPDKMDEIAKYLIENITNPILLKDISKRFGMSNSGFCHFFKRHTQRAYTEYLNELRISRACKLIIENKLNISQIAYECGFNNISYFNNRFKKYMNMHPTEYKMRYLVAAEQ